MKPVLALGLFLASTLPALAGPYDGSWDFSDAACGQQLSDGRLIIDDTILRFWESSCTLSNPVAIRDMPAATLYDASCSGEGYEWNTRFLLSVFGAGNSSLLVMQNNDASIRFTCTPQPQMQPESPDLNSK
ncbi:hypothetical protein LCM17_14680 [Cereibacter sphaeroides]|nr:hypothetical protein [Cereibacter sphaeroides]